MQVMGYSRVHLCAKIFIVWHFAQLVYQYNKKGVKIKRALFVCFSFWLRVLD